MEAKRARAATEMKDFILILVRKVGKDLYSKLNELLESCRDSVVSGKF